MSPLPTIPSSTGESWEVVETTRAKAVRHIDYLVDSIAACDCGNTPDGLEHYDSAVESVFKAYAHAPTVYPSLLAEALTRLAAARKAGEL